MNKIVRYALAATEGVGQPVRCGGVGAYIPRII
jgi:hypothetical protein